MGLDLGHKPLNRDAGMCLLEGSGGGRNGIAESLLYGRLNGKVREKNEREERREREREKAESWRRKRGGGGFFFFIYPPQW